MKKIEGDKALNMRVPASLHGMLKKMSVDLECSVTEIIINYLEWLYEQHWRKRKPLDANSKEEFDVETMRPRRVPGNKQPK